MKEILTHLFYVMARLGAPGLLIMGALDSSFLFMPLGNDLLMLGLTARHHESLVLYAALAALGSTIGSCLIDLLSRKGGEEGLSKILPKRRIEFVKRRINQSAGWTIVLAALLPPPFPFTPVIAAAAAFQYSRYKLLGLVFVFRLIRFALIGYLAIRFGKQILVWIELPAVRYTMLALVGLMIVGSILSVYGWIQRSRRAAA